MQISYKHYRILFHLFVLTLGMLPPLLFYNSLDASSKIAWKIWSFTLVMIPFYVTNIAFLVPEMLQRRKYVWYVLSLISMVALFRYSLIFFVWFDHPTIQFIINAKRLKPVPPTLFPPVFPFLLFILMGTTFEMMLDWDRRGKLIEKAEREKLTAELSFLKSQINPHFFFNTLNSIYALAKSDSQKTQQAILLLSSLMRYVLYESNVERIRIQKEVQFLTDFIALHRLRYSRSNRQKVHFRYKCERTEFDIEPLLLVPFVENAFKHSHSYVNESEICITVMVEHQRKLTFIVSNTIGEYANALEKKSGLGLENIKKRLELLYPDKHQLHIRKSNQMFRIMLTIVK